MSRNVLAEEFGPIDIYLYDQLLKGRIAPGMTVLDAGCGGGRNLVYLMRAGYTVFGVDADAGAVDGVRSMAGALSPGLAPGNFRVEMVEAMSFADGFADVVVSNAVLHFARDDRQFAGMVNEMWRVLARGGMLFCRLASSIGIEGSVRRIEGRRHWLPDGSERYLVDEALLMEWTARLGGRLLDPLKTTVVLGARSMTTWVVGNELGRDSFVAKRQECGQAGRPAPQRGHST
jgi:SAM-dependent methyltransferase